MIFRQFFDNVSCTYTYLIASPEKKEAIIIDSVFDNVDIYLKLLNELDLKLVKVIDTHIHADHISGMAKLRDRTNCVTLMGDKTPADIVSMSIADGEEIKIGNIKLKALYTPGHTSESFSFLMKDRVFTGDTLLIRGTGRTDFQNGNPYDSYNSIFKILLKLPEETFVYPAHDYKGDLVSTIGKEKKLNPRLQVKSPDEYAEIMNNLNLPNPKLMDIVVPKNLNLGINLKKQTISNGLYVDKFKEEIENKDNILIDLREEDEIKKYGKISNCTMISFPKIESYLSQNEKELKNKKILFYCAVGHRSALAVQISKSYNYVNCFHLIGGLKNWKMKGMKTI